MAATLGLSTYRWNNNLKSILLLLIFPFLLLLLLDALVYLFALLVLADRTGQLRSGQFLRFGLDSVTGTHGAYDFACAAALAYWPYVAAGAAAWLIIAYLFNDRMIHRATGATPVGRTDQPRLYGLIETLCISRGLPVPRLYLIETSGLNAYASGIDRRTYSITVTQGLLDGLTDAELEAVLAHELSHIIDRDVRLLIVTILFVGVISFVAQLFWRSLIRMRIRGGAAAVFVLAAAAVGAVGYLLALILRFAISREREYLADAGSVELTKRPEDLISALRKIAGHCEVPHVPSEVRQMFIENPPTVFGFSDLFATHPPLSRRIQRLSELGGLPLPQDTPRLDTPALAANMAELREAMQGLQSQLQSLPRAGPSAPALPSPAASAAPRSGKRGLGDVLLIAVGLALGAVIALVLIP